MHDPSEDTPSHHEEQPDTAGAGHEAGHPSPSANTALSDISLNDESASPHAATGSIKLPSEHESLSRTERANTPSFGAE
ncbi:MAG TPA: hypothetical protein VFL85_03450, partial [Candidatus Saccharimonadales bacterium]|nr:hypothetical protein [Candidatus Saccharimonadales bacterium]